MTTESWENAADPCLLSGREHTHEQVKDDEIRDEEAISDRMNFRRYMRATSAEKSPFATSIVTSRPAGRADLVADGSDDVIAAEDSEIENETEPEGADFVWFNVDDFSAMRFIQKRCHPERSEGSLGLA